MVPKNIIWAFFSASVYESKIFMARAENKPEPKDVYYQTPKGEWVKVTAIFDCIDKARKTYNHADVKYLGAVLADTKGEIERGRRFPPDLEDKKRSEQIRKEEIKNRLKPSTLNKYSKMIVNFNELPALNPSNKQIESFWATFDDYPEDYGPY